MRDVLLTVVTLSLSGSLIALLLLLLRPLLKKHTSKAWQYYVLLIVVLRLLLPFAPEHNLMEAVIARVHSQAPVNSEAEMFPNEPPADLPLPETEIPDSPIQEGEVSGAPVEFVATASAVDFLGIVWCTWLAGALLLFLSKTISYHLFVRRAKTWCSEIQDDAVSALYRDVCDEMRVRRPPALARSKNLPAPALLGAFRPVIALQGTGMSNEQLRHIFRHELTHYKRLDIVYKWLVQLALCLHWFNPLVHLLSKEINRLCELSCDEAVIRGLDKNGMRAYGDMLLDSIQAGIALPSRTAVSITLCEDKMLVKERLESIMHFKKRSSVSIAFSALLATALFVGASFVGVHAAGRPEPTDTPADMNAAQAENVSEATAVQAKGTPTTQVSSPAAGRGEIVKSLSAEGISGIDIYAELCTLVVEQSSTGQFEVVLSYPAAAQINYENHFDLGVVQSGNTIAISTDYENQRWDTSFEEIDGFGGSRYARETILTVRVPQKQYAALRVTLNVTGNTFDLSGVDASSLSIYNATGNLTVNTDRAFDDLSFENNVGNVTLQIPALGSQLDISSRVGHFILALPAEPNDVMLTARDITGNGYDVNCFLPDSWLMARGDGADSFQRGDGSNEIKVGLTDTSGFELMIGGVSNLD